MQQFASVTATQSGGRMGTPTHQDLIRRFEQLLAEGAALHDEHRRVHYERVRQFERAKELHFTEPRFSQRPLPESPKLPGEH